MSPATLELINAVLAARARLRAFLDARHAATQRRAVRAATLSGYIRR